MHDRKELFKVFEENLFAAHTAEDKIMPNLDKYDNGEYMSKTVRVAYNLFMKSFLYGYSLGFNSYREMENDS